MKKISIIALVILVGLLAGCNSSKESNTTIEGVTTKSKVDIMNDEETVSEEDDTVDWDDLVSNIADYKTEELLALYTDSEGDYADILISELTSRYIDNPKDVLSLIYTAENVETKEASDEEENDSANLDEEETTGNVFRHLVAYNIGYELKSKDLSDSELAKLISGEGLDLTSEEETYFQDIVDGYES